MRAIFYCPIKKLAIEIDGSERIDSESDKRRTKFLNEVGIQVLRFWNNEVDNNLDGVIFKIITTLNPSLERREGGKDMKLHKFFIEEKIGEQKRIAVQDEPLIHQWRNVFRMKAGDEIVLLDNSGFEYPAKFLSLKKNKAEFEILEKRKNEVVPKREVVLYQSLIKKDKFEWVVQKCTELGVSEFVPVLSERSEKKDLNLERLSIIAREAAEQSGRGKIPKLNETKKLKEILDGIKNNAIVFDASGVPFQTFQLKNFSTYRLSIGPEGGFTPSELELFKSKNIPIVSLGNMTLRAETAAVAVASLLLL